MSKKLASDLVAILSDLIALPSPYPPGTSVEICAYAAKRLRKAGYKVEIATKTKGVDNVVARLKAELFAWMRDEPLYATLGCAPRAHAAYMSAGMYDEHSVLDVVADAITELDPEAATILRILGVQDPFRGITGTVREKTDPQTLLGLRDWSRHSREVGRRPIRLAFLNRSRGP